MGCQGVGVRSLIGMSANCQGVRAHLRRAELGRRAEIRQIVQEELHKVAEDN
jgi:hypothetical protein